MQTLSSVGQNIVEDISLKSPATSTQLPGTSGLSTGQAPSYSSMPFSGQQALGNQPFQQGLQGQQFGQQGLQNQPFQQQGLQGQQFQPQLNQGFNQGLQGQQQGLQGQQGFSQQGLQGQQLGQQGLQNQPFQQQGLQGQQFGQQGLPNQQFANQQDIQGQQLQQQATTTTATAATSTLGSQPIQQQGMDQTQAKLPAMGGIQQQGYLQQEQIMAQQVQIAPVVVEKREGVAVIQERIRREEVEEITPVIHREREKTEIHKITQPVHTSAVLGIMTEEVTLPAQFSEMRTPSMLPPASILPRREELSAQKMRIEKAPVVIETERKKIIEEVTPVVYREVVEPHITRLTQPIYEKIVEGDVYISETRPAQVLQTSYSTNIPVQTTQFVQQTQNVPVQIPVQTQLPFYSRNIEVADTFVKEGVPITAGPGRGVFGRRAV
jgi:hypothetical protein